MKKQILIFGVLLCFWMSPGGWTHAEEEVFTKTYNHLKQELNETSVEKTAKILGTEKELVLEYIQRGQLTDEEENSLLRVCLPKDAADDFIMSKSEKDECLANIQGLWEDERAYIRDEVLQAEKTMAFTKPWDGQLDDDEDFDNYSQLHMLDRQFSGNDTKTYNVPTANKGNQYTFSLEENDYRVPTGSLPFASSGGCEKGEVSLYGGLVCLPEFCSDFMCLEVRAVPGQKGSSASVCERRSSEASMKNIICGMEDIANTLKESDQTTPTRNSNRSFHVSQIFDSLMNSKTNFSFLPKAPPIFSTEEESSSESEEENPEAERAAEDFRKELDRVRREEFNACQEGESCTSEEVLTSFFYDCGLFGNRGSFGPRYEFARKCAEEKIELLKRQEEEARVARQKMIRDIKKEFYQDMPENLNELWEAMATFEDALLNLNLCKIQQAKYRCGMEKMDCSIKDQGL